MAGPGVLLIGSCDESEVAVRDALEYLGIDSHHAQTADEAQRLFREGIASLAVIFRGSTRPGPLELCRQLRNASPDGFILLIHDHDEPSERALAYELGADHFLALPISRLELRARLRALLRRAAPKNGNGRSPAPRYELRDLVIDTGRKEVRRAGALISLTPTEYRLLELLFERQGVTLSHDVLADSLWGFDSDVYIGNVKYHLSRLRRKIEPDPEDPQYLKTIRGLGYRLVEPDELHEGGENVT